MRGFTPEKASIVGQLPFGKALLEMQILKLIFPPVNLLLRMFQAVGVGFLTND